MAQCDICGSEARLVRARIEGSEMWVCPSCAKFGKVLEAPRSSRSFSRSSSGPSSSSSFGRPRAPPRRPEVLQVIVSDYSKRIRQARERLGLTQKEFAKKLSEKESVIHKLESSQFKPSIRLARKLESALKIVLVDQVEGGSVPFSSDDKKRSAGFTMGDFIKTKK